LSYYYVDRVSNEQKFRDKNVIFLYIKTIYPGMTKMGGEYLGHAGPQTIMVNFLTHTSEHLTIMFVTSVEDKQPIYYCVTLHKKKKYTQNIVQ